MHGMRVLPRQRCDIRAAALALRQQIGLENELRFPIVEYVELILPKTDKNFEFRVAEMEELGSNHGLTYRDNNSLVIAIRNDVYIQACNDYGRDRGTVAHELGHYLMHIKETVFARNFEEPLKSYEDPEWQAKCFQGELLVPRHLVMGMSAEQVANVCGVSRDAAAYQLKMYADGK